MRRNLPLAIAIFVLFAVAAGFIHRAAESRQAVKAAEEAQTEITYIGEEGKTVFSQLLEREGAEVTYSKTELGVFVECIRRLCNSRQRFWVYSVDRVLGEVASDRRLLKGGEVVTWHYTDAF